MEHKVLGGFSLTIANALNASASTVDTAQPIQLFSGPSLINKILTLTCLPYFSPPDRLGSPKDSVCCDIGWEIHAY